MHKILLTILIAFFIQGITIGQIQVNPLKVQAEGNIEDAFEAYALVKNTSNKTLEVSVVREMENIQENWYISLFLDDENYSPFVESFSFSLRPKASKKIGVYFFPEGTEGISSVDLRFSTASNQPKTLAIQSFKGRAIDEEKLNLPKEELRMYPNPATTQFRINDYTSVSRIEVFNIIGKRLKSFPVTSIGQQFEVGELNRGIYLVRFLDENENVIITQRLNIIKP